MAPGKRRRATLVVSTRGIFETERLDFDVIVRVPRQGLWVHHDGKAVCRGVPARPNRGHKAPIKPTVKVDAWSCANWELALDPDRVELYFFYLTKLQ